MPDTRADHEIQRVGDAGFEKIAPSKSVAVLLLSVQVPVSGIASLAGDASAPEELCFLEGTPICPARWFSVHAGKRVMTCHVTCQHPITVYGRAKFERTNWLLR